MVTPMGPQTQESMKIARFSRLETVRESYSYAKIVCLDDLGIEYVIIRAYWISS